MDTNIISVRQRKTFEPRAEEIPSVGGHLGPNEVPPSRRQESKQETLSGVPLDFYRYRPPSIPLASRNNPEVLLVEMGSFDVFEGQVPTDRTDFRQRNNLFCCSSLLTSFECKKYSLVRHVRTSPHTRRPTRLPPRVLRTRGLSPRRFLT